MPELKDLFKDISCLSPEEISSLKEYKESIHLLSEKKLNLEFNNKGYHHAALVMAEIFRTAEHSLKIFTGSFSGEISNNPVYLNELRTAISNRDKSVEVVFEKTPNDDSLCLKILKDLRKEGKKISLYLLNKEYRENTLEKKYKNTYGHFTIGDDRMFRYETDKKEFKAFCNFDDKVVVTSLSNTFSVFKFNSTLLS